MAVIGSRQAEPASYGAGAPLATILQIKDLHKRFGGNVVLNGMDIDVSEGEIRGLIGPNGAGKSTLFNIVNGILKPDTGSVRFRGNDITGKRLSAVARSGIGRTFQMARTFSEMTLIENMLVPAAASSLSSKIAKERAAELLDLAQLTRLKDSLAAEISGGQRKLLEFARTMMLQPSLVLLDEPFNGINPALIEKLLEMIRSLNTQAGVTFVLVSHEMPHVSELCHSVSVLAAGRTLMTGKPDEVRADPRVIEAYLGH